MNKSGVLTLIAMIIAVVVITAPLLMWGQKKTDECRAKGGVLLRSAWEGSICVKVEELK